MAATALGGLAVAALIMQRRQMAALEEEVRSNLKELQFNVQNRLKPAMYMLLKDGCDLPTRAAAKIIMEKTPSD